MASDFAITVTTTYPQGPPGTRLTTPESLFMVPIGAAIAVFLSAFAVRLLRHRHLRPRRLRARPWPGGINRFRWVEYSVSATLMVLLIASYSGITDITAVAAIAGANIAMICSRLQERMNPPGVPPTTMLPFWFGTIAGLAPWVAIGVNVLGAKEVPGFVYGIVVAELVFFFSFGLNQWLQYRGLGRWKSYAYGEKAYLVLSLAAKSVLAWQIYGGSLAD